VYPGNNMLMRMLYEVDGDTGLALQQRSIIEVPSLWRYREQISLEHSKLSLENLQLGGKNKKKSHPHPVLHLFFREVCSFC